MLKNTTNYAINEKLSFTIETFESKIEEIRKYILGLFIWKNKKSKIKNNEWEINLYIPQGLTPEELKDYLETSVNNVIYWLLKLLNKAEPGEIFYSTHIFYQTQFECRNVRRKVLTSKALRIQELTSKLKKTKDLEEIKKIEAKIKRLTPENKEDLIRKENTFSYSEIDELEEVKDDEDNFKNEWINFRRLIVEQACKERADIQKIYTRLLNREKDKVRIDKKLLLEEKNLKEKIFEWINENKKISPADKERLLTTFTF